jgi:hypothetical protein
MEKIVDFKELQSDGDRFEHVVTRILQRKGFKMIRKRAIGPDKGRDFIFEESLDSLVKPKKRKWVVQCKLSVSNVGFSGVNNIEKTLKVYGAESYLLVVSSDVTVSLIDYLDSFSGEYDIDRWTYHELQEELLMNLDIFSEYFPKSYTGYMERWHRTEIDICNSLKKTTHTFSNQLIWDSTRRWQAYHSAWCNGNLQVKKMQNKVTILIENPVNSKQNQFAVALNGETYRDEFRLLNICKPQKLEFTCLYDGEFVFNLEVTGEDRNPYFIAYASGLPYKNPHESSDGYYRYANYHICEKNKIGRYLKVERIVSEDLIKLYSVAPLIVNRICLTTTKTAKIRDLKIFA